MENKKKFIIIGFIGFSAFFLLILFNFIVLQNYQPNLNQTNENRNEKLYMVENITVLIDYSGIKDNERYENINLINYETTAYHALLNCCDVKIQDYGWGLFVIEINNVGPGWVYNVNNDPPPSIPVNFFYLLNNDTIKWKHV
ncbi:MAG: hypothetical protein ACFFD5_04635 [Candidatus Thorarchaeota archaeon]